MTGRSCGRSHHPDRSQGLKFARLSDTVAVRVAACTGESPEAAGCSVCGRSWKVSGYGQPGCHAPHILLLVLVLGLFPQDAQAAEIVTLTEAKVCIAALPTNIHGSICRLLTQHALPALLPLSLCALV